MGDDVKKLHASAFAFAFAFSLSSMVAHADEPPASPDPAAASGPEAQAAGPAPISSNPDLAAAPAPREKRFVPTVAVGIGGQSERLELNLAGTRSTAARSDLRLSTMIGIAHPVASLGSGRARVDGHAAVGFGPTFIGGRYQIPLREDVTFAYEATRWLTLRGGLGVGVVVDATRSAMSYGEVGLPLGVTFWRTLELVYRPYLSVPLGSEDRTVFGGSQTRSASPELVPLELALRVRWARLGF